MFFVIGFLIGGLLTGAAWLYADTVLLSWSNLSRGTQATIAVTTVSALGTLFLAGGAFVNIIQTNRIIKSQENERVKPLAKDELAEIIQPAIDAVETNLRDIQSPRDGRARRYDWVYSDGPQRYVMSESPQGMPRGDPVIWGSLYREQKGLFNKIRNHDMIVDHLCELGDRFQRSVSHCVDKKLNEAGYSAEEHETVVISAILKELDKFGEGHELSDFWLQNREELMACAEDEGKAVKEEIKDLEETYTNLLTELRSDLLGRRAYLQQKYGISVNEIREDDRETDPTRDL